MANKLNHIAVSLTQLAGSLLAMGHVPDVSVVGSVLSRRSSGSFSA